MKNKKPNAERVWKHIEDFLVPRLRLSITDRAVYSHLLRHSRLEGKVRLRFSIPWLARGVGLCANSTRWAVRRFVSRGVLRLIQCSKAGHVLEVLLPDEICTASPDRPGGFGGHLPPSFPRAIYSEDVDFLKTAALRKAIHSRERGRCFYCLRQHPPMARCLDPLLPPPPFRAHSHPHLAPFSPKH